MESGSRPRRGGNAYRRAAFLAVCLLLVPAAVSAVTYTPDPLRPGTVAEPANGTTVISTQGYGPGAAADGAKPSRLVGVGPAGDLRWVHAAADHGVRWLYDVDPLDDGTLLVTGTKPGGTVVYAWDPRTNETVWREELAMEDTHDADLINGDQLLVTHLRNYNESTGRNGDRVAVYDRSAGEVVWEWTVRDHYDRDSGGDYTDDWTHLNDVDEVGPGRYMVSLRNMDQVVVVNRSTGEVTARLGEDGNHSVLYAQHNPDHLVGENGTPAILVADSENDRVVEYARAEDGSGWTRTWTLGSSESLNWPRDADRLPNGNTLVVDTLNHRVVEVTPRGRVVWEYYATWGPYDAERVELGNEPGGPTARELNATGRYEIRGSAGATPGARTGTTFARWTVNAFAGTPVGPEVRWVAARWAHVTPWVRPVWMGSWAFAAATAAALLALLWGGGELLARRDRIAATVRRGETERRRD